MIIPNSGGTYRQNPDGSIELIDPPTGERDCPCSPPEPEAPAQNEALAESVVDPKPARTSRRTFISEE